MTNRKQIKPAPNSPFRCPISNISKADRAQQGWLAAMALGKPTGGASKATRARIQEAIEQEERTRRNVEALNDGDKDE